VKALRADLSLGVNILNIKGGLGVKVQDTRKEQNPELKVPLIVDTEKNPEVKVLLIVDTEKKDREDMLDHRMITGRREDLISPEAELVLLLLNQVFPKVTKNGKQ